MEHADLLARMFDDAALAVGQLGDFGDEDFRHGASLEHDPEKWEPVFGKDHAQTKS
jgi:hypothetical protein